MSTVEDGRYAVTPQPVYWSQFASEDRVSYFLSHPGDLASDSRWSKFGFESADEYAFWAPRLCGLICAKMVFDGYGSASSKTIADLTAEGVALGGYRLCDDDGTLIDKGWYYAPLIELARNYGLDGRIFDHATIEVVTAAVLAGQVPICSVHPGVIRGDIDRLPDGASGGHLVVVVGFNVVNGVVASLVAHNPSGRLPETQASCIIPVERFSEAFAGRGFLLWKCQLSVFELPWVQK